MPSVYVKPSFATGGRLSLSSRVSLVSRMIPLYRVVFIGTLLLTFFVSGFQFFSTPSFVGALEFTPHVIGDQGGAVGVLDVVAADMNGNGRQDVVTAGLDGVNVYIREESGSFTRRNLDSAQAERVQVIDMNGDEMLDMVVTFKSDVGVKWFRNMGNYVFSATSIVSGQVVAAHAGDVNGNGAIDVVAAVRQEDVIALRRFMHDGEGVFSSSVLESDTGVSVIAVADMNGNGYAEIVTGGSRGVHMWKTGNGTSWSSIEVDPASRGVVHLDVRDISRDGHADIVASDQASSRVTYYRYLQNDVFERRHIAHDIEVSTVRIADVNGNGHEDVLAASRSHGGVVLLLNNGAGDFDFVPMSLDLERSFSVSVADMNGDGMQNIVAGDHVRGAIYWYDRSRAFPHTSIPVRIRQAQDGSGHVSFEVSISDPDFDSTSLKVEYSLNETDWFSLHIVSAEADMGTVDVHSESEFQVGARDSIDTNTHDRVGLTIVWDTKSQHNAGPALDGDIDAARIRVIPRNSAGPGEVAVSYPFRIDNEAPRGFGPLRVVESGEDWVTLEWGTGADGSPFEYFIHYGADRSDVVERVSQVWSSEHDSNMSRSDNNTTTITGLSSETEYIFKLFAKDSFGNVADVPSVDGATLGGADSLEENVREGELVARAGNDQVVNPYAFVMLDATSSFDPQGAVLSYDWQQLSGPDVELIRDDTATPSFYAGGPDESYVFEVAVRNAGGDVALDTVTVSTRTSSLHGSVAGMHTIFEDTPTPAFVRSVLFPLNIFLLSIVALATLMALIERGTHLFRNRYVKRLGVVFDKGEGAPRGRVLHYKTGKPLSGARVLVYGADGKLRATDRTNTKGEFASLFPQGEYTVRIHAPGFVCASSTSAVRPAKGVLYTGGTLTVRDGTKPINIVVPMKPTSEEVASIRIWLLHVWQRIQRLGRVVVWPLCIAGVLLNAALIFWDSSYVYLVISAAYIALVVTRMVLEVRARPAYGLVRDAMTGEPLDLAVVRLYDQETNRLVMTRATNMHGKFFAIPHSGTYTVTIAKPGYASFTKRDVVIKEGRNSVLQVTADLMPLAPATHAVSVL